MMIIIHEWLAWSAVMWRVAPRILARDPRRRTVTVPAAVLRGAQHVWPSHVHTAMAGVPDTTSITIARDPS